MTMSDSKTVILMTLYMSLCVISFDIRSQNFIKTKNTRIVSSEASYRTAKAKSGIQCSAVCTSDESCCSSSFDTHTNMCRLFSTYFLMTEYAEGYEVTKKTLEPVCMNGQGTLMAMIQLRKSLVPNWFLNTKLCFDWYADGESGQCGGGVSNKLCAKVNEWTIYYKDQSDSRGGGCQMRWGIESAGYDSWFDNVQICYQWISVGSGRDPCGGGETCGNVDTPTNYYRDDTDGSSKGCQMQWKLSVQVDSPEWIQNAKFCYQWYTEDNKGQCGGIPNGLYCAKANSFTTFYSDHSNENAGGCYMRWKILTDA